MNKRQGFAPILIIILAAVIAVGGIGAGIAWKTELLDDWLPNNVKELFDKETIDEEGGISGEDATRDWKSFSSDSLDISLKHPTDWDVEESAIGGSIFLTISSPDYSLEDSGVGRIANGKSLNVTIEGSADGKSVSEWVEDFFDPFPYQVREQKSVAGYESIQIESSLGTGGGLAVTSYVSVRGQILSFSCQYPFDGGDVVKESCAQILDLILGTVEFD